MGQRFNADLFNSTKFYKEKVEKNDTDLKSYHEQGPVPKLIMFAREVIIRLSRSELLEVWFIN